MRLGQAAFMVDTLRPQGSGGSQIDLRLVCNHNANANSPESLKVSYSPHPLTGTQLQV